MRVQVRVSVSALLKSSVCPTASSLFSETLLVCVWMWLDVAVSKTLVCQRFPGSFVRTGSCPQPHFPATPAQSWLPWATPSWFLSPGGASERPALSLEPSCGSRRAFCWRRAPRMPSLCSGFCLVRGTEWEEKVPTLPCCPPQALTDFSRAVGKRGSPNPWERSFSVV